MPAPTRIPKPPLPVPASVKRLYRAEKVAWAFHTSKPPRLTPDETRQIRVAAHPWPTARCRLAAYHAITPTIARLLADDTGSRVQSTLATNPQTDAALLTYLLMKRPGVWTKVVTHPNCPVPILRSFLDQRPRPETAAALEGMSRDILYWCRAAVLTNPALPARVAYRPDRNGNLDWRVLCARPDCPPEQIIELTSGPHLFGQVVDRIVDNPVTPNRALRNIMRFDSMFYEHGAMIRMCRHPNVSVGVLRRIARDYRKTVAAAAAEGLARRGRTS